MKLIKLLFHNNSFICMYVVYIMTMWLFEPLPFIQFLKMFGTLVSLDLEGFTCY